MTIFGIFVLLIAVGIVLAKVEMNAEIRKAIVVLAILLAVVAAILVLRQLGIVLF